MEKARTWGRGIAAFVLAAFLIVFALNYGAIFVTPPWLTVLLALAAGILILV